MAMAGPSLAFEGTDRDQWLLQDFFTSTFEAYGETRWAQRILGWVKVRTDPFFSLEELHKTALS